jgi:2,4-dienoyl-CoA reductase-like NADH-dependent reductase (Old Yellow Enzyme family)/ribulose 1,5-bisphosphate synthetase/thiazole synthase
MSMALTRIFEPLQVGPVVLPNRVVRTAHGATEEGHQVMPDSYIAYHAARAKGGCGLTILGACSVHPSSRLFEYGLFRDNVVADYQRLMAQCRPHGMKVFAQLWHGGNLYNGYGGGPGWAVSDVPGMLGQVPLRMTGDMIRDLIEAYVACAIKARDGGLDGVEIHAAHGYLPQQFLSPFYNDRTDEWGGSFANRSRFLMEVLRGVRRAVGGDLAISMRLAASDMPGGIGVEENRQVLHAVQDEGLIDLVNVSRGDYYRMDTMVGAMQNPTGYEIPSSGAIAAVARVPRLLAGRFRTLDDAEQLLRDGEADLVSMVRAQIADPDLVNKTRAGRALDVRPCIGCNQQHRGGRFGCAVNPAAGAEQALAEDLIARTAAPKKVLVAGGGPAGLEAARVAALKGHAVVLCEAAPVLGGMLNAARRAPHSASFGDIVIWLEQEVYRLGVDIRLNTYMDAADVAAEQADHVIVATGSMPRMDGLQHTFPAQAVGGIAQPHVVSSIEVLMEPRDWGASAVVLDTVGDYEALAVCEHLLTQGLNVTYVTPATAMAEKSERHWPAHERFVQLGNFAAVTRHHLVDVQRDRVLIRPHLAARQNVRAIAADTVVLVTPNQPLRDLYEALRDTVANLDLVGDARQPRNLLRAIWEGHGAARAIA